MIRCARFALRIRRAAQLASTSVPTLTGLERLAAAAGVGGGVGGFSDPSSAKKGNKLFKSLGFGASKQEETNDFTHMRCAWHVHVCVATIYVVYKGLLQHSG